MADGASVSRPTTSSREPLCFADFSQCSSQRRCSRLPHRPRRQQRCARTERPPPRRGGARVRVMVASTRAPRRRPPPRRRPRRRPSRRPRARRRRHPPLHRVVRLWQLQRQHPCARRRPHAPPHRRHRQRTPPTPIPLAPLRNARTARTLMRRVIVARARAIKASRSGSDLRLDSGALAFWGQTPCRPVRCGAGFQGV